MKYLLFCSIAIGLPKGVRILSAALHALLLSV
jgi:hypothetical protein